MIGKQAGGRAGGHEQCRVAQLVYNKYLQINMQGAQLVELQLIKIN
jgi:hypothetical protein